jgi:hypothetical protein
MARVYTYMIVGLGLMLLTKFAGIPTGVDWLLTWFGVGSDPSQISFSAFYIAIAGILALATTTGIIIGSFTRTTPEVYLIAPLAISFLSFVSAFTSIVTYASSNYSGWIANVAILIFVPMTAGFVLSIIEWWSNRLV